MEALLTFAKELVLSPGGLKRFGILILKMILILVTGQALVEKFLETDPISLFQEFSQHPIKEIGFFAVIAILALMLSWFVTEILCNLLTIVIHIFLFFRKESQQNPYRRAILDLLPLLLRKFKIAKKDQGEPHFKPLENAWQLKAFILGMQSGESDRITNPILSSLGFQVAGLMLAFLIEYLVFFPAQGSMGMISLVMIPSILVLCSFTYANLIVLEELELILNDLEPLASYLEVKGWVKSSMSRFGLSDSGIAVRKIDHIVEDNGTRTFLLTVPDGAIIRLHHAMRFWKKHQNSCQKAIIFTPQPATSEALEFAKETNERLIVVHADSEKAVLDAFYIHFG